MKKSIEREEFKAVQARSLSLDVNGGVDLCTLSPVSPSFLRLNADL